MRGLIMHPRDLHPSETYTQYLETINSNRCALRQFQSVISDTPEPIMILLF